MKVKKPGIYLACWHGREFLVTVEGFSCDYAYAYIGGRPTFFETDGWDGIRATQLTMLLLPLKES